MKRGQALRVEFFCFTGGGKRGDDQNSFCHLEARHAPAVLARTSNTPKLHTDGMAGEGALLVKAADNE